MSTYSFLYPTAVHESSHGLILMMAGIPIERLEASTATGGLCRAQVREADIPAAARCLCSLAGAAGVRLLCPHAKDRQAALLSKEDEDLLILAQRQLGIPDRAEFVRRQALAEELVGIHAGSIKALAAELARRGSLDAAALGQVCRETPELRKFARLYPEAPPPPKPAPTPASKPAPPARLVPAQGAQRLTSTAALDAGASSSTGGIEAQRKAKWGDRYAGPTLPGGLRWSDEHGCYLTPPRPYRPLL
jgi:hypothetical protein